MTPSRPQNKVSVNATPNGPSGTTVTPIGTQKTKLPPIQEGKGTFTSELPKKSSAELGSQLPVKAVGPKQNIGAQKTTVTPNSNKETNLRPTPGAKQLAVKSQGVRNESWDNYSWLQMEDLKIEDDPNKEKLAAELFKIQVCEIGEILDSWINPNSKEMITLLHDLTEQKLILSHFTLDRLRGAYFNEQIQICLTDESIDISQLRFTISADYKMMAFRTRQHIAIINIQDIATLFSKELDIESKLNDKFTMFHETQNRAEKQLEFVDFGFSEEGKIIIAMKFVSQSESEKPKMQLYHSLESLIGLVDLIDSYKSEFSINQESFFEQEQIETLDPNITTEEISIKEGFAFMINRTAKIFKVYNPQTHIKISLKEDSSFSSREYAFSSAPTSIKYNPQEDLLYLQMDERIEIFKRFPMIKNTEESEQDHSIIVQPEFFYFHDYWKLDPKIIRKEHIMVKVFDGYAYFKNSYLMKIWNIEQEALVGVVGGINEVHYNQIYNTHLILAGGHFYNVFQPSPFKERITNMKDYCDKVSGENCINMKQIEVNEKSNDKDFENYRSKYSDYNIADYIPEINVVILNNENFSYIYYFKDSTIQKIGNQCLGEMKFRNIIYSADASSETDFIYVLFFLSKTSLIALTIPSQNPKNIGIHTIQNNLPPSNKQDAFYCRKNNEIVISLESYDQTTLLLLQISAAQKSIRCLSSCTPLYKGDIELKLYWDKELYYNKKYSNVFMKLKVDDFFKEVPGTEYEFPFLKEVTDVVPIITPADNKKYLMIQYGGKLYLSNESKNKVVAEIQNLANSDFRILRDMSNPFTYYLQQWKPADGDIYHKLSIADDMKPLAIPQNLFIKHEIYSQYDQANRILSFYESIEKAEAEESVASIKIRTYLTSYLDYMTKHGLEDKEEENKEKMHKDPEIIEYIKKNATQEILSYNLIHRTDLLDQAINKKDQDKIIDAILTKLELSASNEIPFLYPREKLNLEKNEKQVCFDDALKNKKTTIVKRLINLMIIADQKGFIYCDILDRNLEEILTLKIDIKNYLSSEMPLYEIANEKFPSRHIIKKKLILPSNALSLHEIEQDYENKIEPYLNMGDIGFFDYFFCCGAGHRRKHLKVASMAKNQQDIVRIPENPSDETFDIKYQVVNLKNILAGNDKKNFMILVQEQSKKDIKYLEIETLQTVIDFKFEAYTRSHFLREFWKLAFFIICFLIDVCILIPYSNQATLDDSVINSIGKLTNSTIFQNSSIFSNQSMIKNQSEIPSNQSIDSNATISDLVNGTVRRILQDVLNATMNETEPEKKSIFSNISADELFGTYDMIGGKIAIRVICTLYMIDFFISEMRQLAKSNLKVYLTKDMWNISDNILFLLYVVYLPISFLSNSKEEDYTHKSLQCTIILFLTIKINFFLRMFKSFSFLVQMILAVFMDLFYFLIYYCIIIIAFSIQISIIMEDVADHEGIGPAMWFVMTLRTSLGDNDIGEEYSQYKILFWIIWVLIMFVGNIVLMNFIIAVVNESYTKCMETMKAQTYKVKVDMIVERESLMGANELTIAELFPNYIIVRKVVDEGDSEEADKNQELIKEMNASTEKIADKLSKTHEDVIDMKKEIHQYKDILKSIQDSLEAISKNLEQPAKPAKKSY